MTYSAAKFEVHTSNGLGEDAFTRKYILRNIAQYPLHHVAYAATKFEVAMANCLGGDAITRNCTHAQADGRRTNFGTKLIYPF